MTPTPNSDAGGHEEDVEANARPRISIAPLGCGGEGDFYPDHGGGRNGVLDFSLDPEEVTRIESLDAAR